MSDHVKATLTSMRNVTNAGQMDRFAIANAACIALECIESLQRENEERPPEHLPSCRKLIYDIKSSPCTCRAEYDRLCTEVDMQRRENAQFRRLLRAVAFEDLDADAADAVTVLEVVIKEARDLLGEQG